LQTNTEQVREALPWDISVDALPGIFNREDALAPIRHLHSIEVLGNPGVTLQLTPTYVTGEYLEVKTTDCSCFDGNVFRTKVSTRRKS
jgi:hypothetical protein